MNIKSVSSGMTIIITYATFLFVDSPQIVTDYNISPYLFNIIPALLVGGIAFTIYYTVEKLFQKELKLQLTEVTKELLDQILKNKKKIKYLDSKLFVLDVCNIERLNAIYADNNPTFLNPVNSDNKTTEQKIQDEIIAVRENFRRNREFYKIPLDFVEEQLKSMYGDYYLDKTSNHEPS